MRESAPVEIKPYTVTIFEFASGRMSKNRVEAYTAEDAYFQAQVNICDKSLVVRDVAKGLEPSSKIYTVEPFVQ